MAAKEQSISIEEAYQLIYTHEEIYIPPTEEGDVGLEVGLGCSWHKCRFCDFARDEFCIHSNEKIALHLSILSQLQPEKEKMFFLGENIFCLSPKRLLEIIDLVNLYMPQIKEFAMYARADDVLKKSREELSLLRSRGIQRLHIGLESGSDSILHWMNKGVSSYQYLEAFRRLDQAGIEYYLTIIPGLAGRKYSMMHAIETANLLNQCHPKNVWALKLKLWEDTPLYQMAQKGEFEEMTPLEILQEEYLMIQHLNLQNCRYVDSTVLNEFTVFGDLPRQKADILHTMKYLLDHFSERKE